MSVNGSLYVFALCSSVIVGIAHASRILEIHNKSQIIFRFDAWIFTHTLTERLACLEGSLHDEAVDHQG